MHKRIDLVKLEVCVGDFFFFAYEFKKLKSVIIVKRQETSS